MIALLLACLLLIAGCCPCPDSSQRVQPSADAYRKVAQLDSLEWEWNRPRRIVYERLDSVLVIPRSHPEITEQVGFYYVDGHWYRRYVEYMDNGERRYN